MASAKRIILNGNGSTSVDYIPYVNGVKCHAYVGGVQIPWWEKGSKRPTVTMTANTTGSFTASASSEYSRSYAAWKAFDNSYSNAYGWASKATDKSPWIQIKLDVPMKDITVTIYNRTRSSLVNGPISGTIYGSDNGSSLTSIGSFSGRSGTTSAGSSTITCNNHSQAYQYVRVSVSNWANKTASSNNYLSIGEIYINGKVAG